MVSAFPLLFLLLDKNLDFPHVALHCTARRAAFSGEMWAILSCFNGIDLCVLTQSPLQIKSPTGQLRHKGLVNKITKRSTVLFQASREIARFRFISYLSTPPFCRHHYVVGSLHLKDQMSSLLPQSQALQSKGTGLIFIWNQKCTKWKTEWWNKSLPPPKKTLDIKIY